MKIGKIRAALQTKFNFKPERSQVFVVALLIVGALCLIMGFILLLLQNSDFWMPLLIGLVLIAISIFLWLISYKNIDMAGSVPTTITDKSSGFSLTTDARTLTETLQNFEMIFSVLGHRKPLPEPDGLVDADGRPQPDKKQEALERVREANAAAADQTKQAMSFLSGKKDIPVIEQPLVEAPADEILPKTNVAENEGDK